MMLYECKHADFMKDLCHTRMTHYYY